jgi:predicted small secreted protein
MRMKLTGLAALLLAASPLVVGCSTGDSCGDVDSLTQQLDDADPDDPDFNDLTEKLQRAEADCNAQ